MGLDPLYKRAKLKSPMREVDEIYDTAQDFVNEYIPSCEINLEKNSVPPQRGLIIVGMGRSGKTYLACAILNALVDMLISQQRFDSFDAIGKFLNIAWFAKQLRDALELSEVGFLEEYLRVEILVVDDLASTRLTDFMAETLYVLINRRLSQLKCTIFTIDMNPLDFGSNDRGEGKRIINRIREITNYSVLKFPDIDIARVIKENAEDLEQKQG